MTMVGRGMAEILHAAGVRRMYTVPGESFLSLLDGVDAHPGIRLISTRHESGASFMADAEAKMTGRPAVVAATRAVGAANLAIGVHTAHQDSSPMVVVLGQADSGFLGRESFQEIDLEAFYRPITKWSAAVRRADRIPEMLSRAVRIARSGRPGPVMISIPGDLFEADVADAEVDIARRRVLGELAGPAPDPRVIRRVANRLASARRPVLIAGAGARPAPAELTAVAEAYAVGVYAAFRRQDVFPNDHPNYLGHLGFGNEDGCLAALREADLVLVAGSRLSEVTTSGYTLPPPTAEVIQIDVDAAVIGSTVPAALGVVCDVGDALRELLAVAGQIQVPDRDWSRAHAAYMAASRLPPPRSAEPVNPSQVIGAMRAVLPEQAVIANDAGNFATFLHQYWPFRYPRSQVAPANGAMGYGVAGAIGAKLAAPHRPVVGVAGDGGFAMSAMEIETAVREDVDVTLIVLSNGLHGTIAMHQARAYGRLAGVRIGQIEVAGIARSLGAAGIKVDDAADLADALAEAYSTPGPAVVEVRTDPLLISPANVLGVEIDDLRPADPRR
ncbi:MAG TPA: thiamine pyrophosphate-dependent enzyme [Streptosporangiaceae bacterium]